MSKIRIWHNANSLFERNVTVADHVSLFIGIVFVTLFVLAIVVPMYTKEGGGNRVVGGQRVKEKPELVTLEAVKVALDKEVRPHRPGMAISRKDVVYEDEGTKLVIYEVTTTNAPLNHGSACSINWTCYLIGNAKGFVSSDAWISSETNMYFRGVTEDQGSVVIKRSWSEWVAGSGYRSGEGNLTFDKKDFNPYKNGNLPAGYVRGLFLHKLRELKEELRHASLSIGSDHPLVQECAKLSGGDPKFMQMMHELRRAKYVIELPSSFAYFGHDAMKDLDNKRKTANEHFERALEILDSIR